MKQCRTDPAAPLPARALIFSLTLLAMVAFAGNSLLCRLALKDTGIDAASFTSIRIVSGALVLWLIVRLRGAARSAEGNWPSAFALFAYAACFSYAYVELPAGIGALLLFGAVQATMIGFGLWNGERFGIRRSAGLACAFGGLVGLMLPGVSAPPLFASASMVAAGCAWGVYSLRGRTAADATAATSGNFLRAVPFAIALAAIAWPRLSLDRTGTCYAIASGALTSGIGYAIWYTALRGLKATSAAVVQLSVPVLAAMGGIILLGESSSLRLALASVAILGGIALVIVEPRAEPAAS
ncbi:MAG TPA: DMT family transporter [Xanthomonadaceae bacterium]|jgi:drug/metabolite transporter (DMT)-like permease|nr:DMT family transporter [Xanthomonadaceae bacterium]